MCVKFRQAVKRLPCMQTLYFIPTGGFWRAKRITQFSWSGCCTWQTNKHFLQQIPNCEPAAATAAAEAEAEAKMVAATGELKLFDSDKMAYNCQLHLCLASFAPANVSKERERERDKERESSALPEAFTKLTAVSGCNFAAAVGQKKLTHWHWGKTITATKCLGNISICAPNKHTYTHSHTHTLAKLLPSYGQTPKYLVLQPNFCRELAQSQNWKEILVSNRENQNNNNSGEHKNRKQDMPQKLHKTETESTNFCF